VEANILFDEGFKQSFLAKSFNLYPHTTETVALSKSRYLNHEE